MIKSVKNYTVFFLAAVLVAGIISISFQSFIDTEASGDKRDHKKNKDYKHQNYKSQDATVSVKKITCNNFDLNINGLRMDISPDDIVSDVVAAQAKADNNNDEEIIANSLGNDERNNFDNTNNDDDGFIFVCIDNLTEQGDSALPQIPPSGETPVDETPYPQTPPPPTETPSEIPSGETPADETPYPQTPPTHTETPESCKDCFLPTTIGGFVPEEAFNKLNNYLETAGLAGVSDLGDVCDAITSLAGTANEVSEEDLSKVLSYALTDDKDSKVIEKIIDCLLDLKLITPALNQ